MLLAHQGREGKDSNSFSAVPADFISHYSHNLGVQGLLNGSQHNAFEVLRDCQSYREVHWSWLVVLDYKALGL